MLQLPLYLACWRNGQARLFMGGKAEQAADERRRRRRVVVGGGSGASRHGKEGLGGRRAADANIM